jgi:hypothetical protein
MNSDRRARAAAAATAVGLVALGGAALGSNHGLSTPMATSTVSANGRAPIVTGASGSSTATAAGTTAAAHRSPIVTRTSAAALAAGATDD